MDQMRVYTVRDQSQQEFIEEEKRKFTELYINNEVILRLEAKRKTQPREMITSIFLFILYNCLFFRFASLATGDFFSRNHHYDQHYQS
jgi:hypothetical protein